jgi:small subunit ribosomal protein S13
MVRILGLNISDKSNIDYALTNLYGIGWSNSKTILKKCNIDRLKKVKDLSEEELKAIINFIENNYKVEGDLREILAENIKRLKDINSYRGVRHNKSLPVRGQRTRSNARTKRGKRKTVGALKKEVRAMMEQEDRVEEKK